MFWNGSADHKTQERVIWTVGCVMNTNEGQSVTNKYTWFKEECYICKVEKTKKKRTNKTAKEHPTE